jgi:hypothetical protein
MPDQVKLFKAHGFHQTKLIICHRAKAVVARIRQARRMLRITVAAQICANHGVVFSQLWRYCAPHRLGLRKAVQHENRCAISVQLAADDASYAYAVHMLDARFKTVKHWDELLGKFV